MDKVENNMMAKSYSNVLDLKIMTTRSRRRIERRYRKVDDGLSEDIGFFLRVRKSKDSVEGEVLDSSHMMYSINDNREGGDVDK